MVLASTTACKPTATRSEQRDVQRRRPSFLPEARPPAPRSGGTRATLNLGTTRTQSTSRVTTERPRRRSSFDTVRRSGADPSGYVCGVVNVVGPDFDGSVSRLAVDRLIREHSNVGLLLLMLDSYFAAMSGGEDVDDALLLDAMTYMTDFVNGFHHPKEELAVEAVADRSAAIRGAKAGLEAQHRRIREVGLSLRVALERTLLDEPIARQRLAEAGFAYAAEMRRSMEREEATVFPALAKGLDADAWHVIDARIGPQTDPLFGETVHQRYAELFRELTDRFGCEEEARYD